LTEWCFMNSNDMIIQQISYFIANSPGIFGLKTPESTIIATTNFNAKLLGCRHQDNLIGKTDYDYPSQASEFARHFLEEDHKVLMEQKCCTFLNIIKYKDEQWRLVISEKWPVFNHNNDLIAIASKARFLDYSDCLAKPFLNLDNLFNNKQTILSSYSVDDFSSLTPKEQECLFFLLRGKTAKQIATLMRINHRTVESYFEKIKLKMNCINKADLIEKSFNLGYQYHIPPCLFSQACSIVLD